MGSAHGFLVVGGVLMLLGGLLLGAVALGVIQ